MGLDITFTERETLPCPHCGEVIGTKDVDSVDSSGRSWYSILEFLGYYVPYDKRTKENDWYGKDMILTREQAHEVYQRIRMDIFVFYNGMGIMGLIAEALRYDNQIVINANW